jgi:hypothetical protein
LNDPNKGVDASEGWEDYRFRVVHVMASEPGKAIVQVFSDAETDARPAAGLCEIMPVAV